MSAPHAVRAAVVRSPGTRGGFHRLPSEPQPEPELESPRSSKAKAEERAKGAGITHRLPGHVRPYGEAAPVLERELRELEPIARGLGRLYVIPGLERCDVEQLARVGLWEALQAYDGTSPLRAFARLVAERRVRDALTAALREKRTANRTALHELTLDGGELVPAVELVREPLGTVERAELRAELRAVVDAAASLTELERRALGHVLDGRPYAARSRHGSRELDNAAQRARRKLRAARSRAHAA